MLDTLMSYLRNNYKPGEPIFISDINLPVSNTNLRQMFKNLCDKQLIKRYENGIYYFNSQSLSASKVVRYKYIARNGRVDGYESGFAFANRIGLTSQVPFVMEIVTNASSAKCREVQIKNQRVLLRSPRVEINSSNSNVLQLLDLLKDLEKYTEFNTVKTGLIVRNYIGKVGISKTDIDKYIGTYPDRIYKTFYELSLYEALA